MKFSVLGFFLLLSSVLYPVNAQSGWYVNQIYHYQTTWSISEEYFNSNNALISSEYLNEQQDFVVKIYDIQEIEETIELVTLFDKKVGNTYDGYRDSVFSSTSDLTYLYSYNYNQSFVWFIPLIHYVTVNSTNYISDVVFNSFDFEPKNYLGDYIYSDYMRYTTSYLFIESNFKSINDNIGSIIKDLDVYDGNHLSEFHYVKVDDLSLKGLEDKVTSISFMGESNLDNGISKLSSTTQKWTLSIDMMNLEFLTPQYNSTTHEIKWEKRVYEKYISSIELSYSNDGTLESLTTKIEKTSTGDNNSINSLFEKTIKKRESVINFIDFFSKSIQYLSYLNGLMIATIIVLLVKRKIKMKKFNIKKEESE